MENCIVDMDFVMLTKVPAKVICKRVVISYLLHNIHSITAMSYGRIVF